MTGRTSSRAGRRAIRSGALLVGLTVLFSVAGSTPALAHGGGAEIANYSVPSRISYVVALAAAVLVAGIALLRPWTGALTEGARRLAVTAGSAGVIANGVVAADRREVEQYSLSAVLLVAALAVLFRANRWLALPVGVGLVVLLSVDALQDTAAAGVLMLGHVLVAAVWSGAVLTSATAAPGTRLAVARRLTPVAVIAAVGASVTGVLSARDRGVSLSGITVTSFGSVVVLKVALLVLIAALGLGARLALRGRSVRLAGGLARAEFGAIALTLVVGVVLSSLPSPGPPARAGVPLVRTVTMDDAGTGVFVVPQRPGRNLVQVMTDRYTEIRIDGRTYYPQLLPTAEGYWTMVDLPAGRTRLEVRQGREVVQQVLDLGSVASPAVFDGPQDTECASAALGAALGGSRLPLTSCPSQALSDRDADALRALITYLDGRKVRTLRLVTDVTPRGRAAQATVAAEAKEAGIAVTTVDKADATLALAGWEAAHRGLADLAKSAPPTYGTFLAPWLLQDPIVAATGTSPLTPLGFNPDSPAVLDYLIALRRVGPEQSASVAGLAAFLAARKERGLADADPGSTVRLFAATSGFEIMPMSGPDGEPMTHPVRFSWLPKGSLTPVTTPLPR